MKSNLQIISGKYRGKKLSLPMNARPTQNMARGALFNMLNEILNMAQTFTVWDAFAGSGAFGLECLSRYDNVKVVFTDNNKTSLDTVNKNLVSVHETAIVEMADAICLDVKLETYCIEGSVGTPDTNKETCALTFEWVQDLCTFLGGNISPDTCKTDTSKCSCTFK